MTSVADIPPPKPRVFVGSSGEAVSICRYLQVELERAVPCEVTLWTQGVFKPSQYTMDGLAEAARRSDFAVLVATPDDTVESRGSSTPAVRDNVILELGLFIGALGRERSYIVADQTDGGLKLPSDLHGLNWLPYKRRGDGNQRAAVAEAVLALAGQIRALGVR